MKLELSTHRYFLILAATMGLSAMIAPPAATGAETDKLSATPLAHSLNSQAVFAGGHPRVLAGRRMTADYYSSMMDATAGFGLLPDLGYRNTRQHQLNLDQQLLSQRFRKPHTGVFLVAGGSYSGIGGGSIPEDRRFSWDAFAGVTFASFKHLEWGLGLSYSGGEYDTSKIYVDARNVNLSVFSRWNNDRFFVDGGILYGFVDYKDVDRQLKVLDTPSSKQRADTDGDAWSLFVRAGYDSVPAQPYRIGPFIALEYTRAEVDSFKEKRSKALTYTGSDGTEVDQFKISVPHQDRDYQRYRIGIFYNAAESARWQWYGEMWLEYNDGDNKSDALISIQSTVGDMTDPLTYNSDNADFFQDGVGIMAGIELINNLNLSANVRLGEEGVVSGINLYYGF